MRFRRAFLIFLILPQFLCAAPPFKKISAEDVSKGPLKISADETISRDRGKVIEASGHVQVNYLMENEDTLESVSEFAKWDQEHGIGEIWGNPDALWKRKDPKEPSTRLLAKKILLKVKGSELVATGNVSVIQSSSTLAAEQVTYSNSQKQMTATGGEPIFTIKQASHRTRIRAQKIVAWTETKEIHFTGHVQGMVQLVGEPKLE